MKKIAIIGGGAAGMAAAVFLARKGQEVVLLERGNRLGRKLSASGNGQGNVSNTKISAAHYFSDDSHKIENILSSFQTEQAVSFLEGMGGIFTADARGRIYPCSRQASAVCDLFRREIERLKITVLFDCFVNDIRCRNDGTYTLLYDGGSVEADRVIVCAGGKAAPNFGTDGNGYTLAQKFGHSVTKCSPALVQLKTNPAQVRSLKGIRVDATLGVLRAGKEIYNVRGDVLFTESGLSGDATFRASSYAQTGDEIVIDLLPDISYARLEKAVRESGLLCVVNNAVAREFQKRAAGDQTRLVDMIKAFRLTVTGTLGFAYAQVTRGGIPLAEVDENLMSRYANGLYFAGEILNVDGECGGYNLHWAFASAHRVAEAIL